MTSRIVVLGWGNPSRGDDAIGPELMHRAQDLVASDPAYTGIALVEDFQLQIEHALDLQNASLALFLDASQAATAPFTLTRLASEADTSTTSHQLSPQAVLQVYAQLGLGPPPPSYLLRVRGDRFDLGAPLAAPAAANLEAAWTLVARLLGNRDHAAWEAQVTGHA